MSKNNSTAAFQTISNQQGNTATGLLLLIVMAGILYFLATHHIVMTEYGLKVYPKRYLTLEESYVDMRRMSIRDLPRHEEVVRVMYQNGDVQHIPGGDVVQKMARAGYTVSEIAAKVNQDYHVTDSAREVSRITQQKYKQLDQRYDIQSKAEKAGEKLKEGASKLHQWLEKQ